MKIVPFWSKTVNSCGLGSVGLGPSFKTPLCLISQDILSSPSATIFPWVVNREVLPELRKPIRQVNWLSESVNTFRPFTLHTESNIYIDRSRNKGGRVVFVSVSQPPGTQRHLTAIRTRGGTHENKHCCLELRLPGFCQMPRAPNRLIFCKSRCCRAKHFKMRGGTMREYTGDCADMVF